MRKFIVFILWIGILFSCNKGDHKNNSLQKLYQSKFPYVDNKLSRGQIVLAPPQKFVDSYLSNDTNNFFAFYPRIIDSVGEEFVRLKEFDTVSVVPNALIIPLGGTKAKKGDFVLTWWHNGTGLQRAYVIRVVDTNNIVVRYLDLEWAKDFDRIDAIDTIDFLNYRVIAKPLDPGSSIALESGINQEYYKVINTTKDKVIAINWAGELKIIDRDKVLANKVSKDLEVGYKVKVPMYGYYIPGVVVDKGQGFVRVEVNFLGDKETLNIPVIDVMVE